MEDKDLINGLKAGDALTFKKLVEKFQLPVINTCLGIVHNRHDAEDLSQDVFLEIIRSVNSFRGDSKLSTWIYRIAINKAINFSRKQKRQKWLTSWEELFTGKHEPGFHSTSTYSPFSEIEKQQRLQHLHTAIDALSENQRIAFTLNKYDELSYQEISEVMNLSISGVESLIHRAKVNLQKKLWSCYQKDDL